MFWVKNITDQIPNQRGYGVQVEGRYINPGNGRQFAVLSEATKRLAGRKVSVDGKEYPIIDIINVSAKIDVSKPKETSFKDDSPALKESPDKDWEQKSYEDKSEKVETKETVSVETNEEITDEPLTKKETEEFVPNFQQAEAMGPAEEAIVKQEPVETKSEIKPSVVEEIVIEAAPKKRGRPKKEKTEPDIKVPKKMTKATGRKRGRPRKQPTEVVT